MFYVEASVGVMDLRRLPSIAHKRGSETRGCASARAGASVEQREGGSKKALLTLFEAQEGDPLDGRVSVFHVLVEVH